MSQVYKDRDLSTSTDLLPFQEEEMADKILPRNKVGIIWDMGLGKTVAGAEYVAQRGLQRVLVLAPDNAFEVWKTIGAGWVQQRLKHKKVKVIFLWGTAAKREKIWTSQEKVPADEIWLYVCTPDTFMRDWSNFVPVKSKDGKMRKRITGSLKIRKDFYIPQIVIFDEARRMRNKDATLFKVLSKFMTYYSVQHFIPMTGTPGSEPRHLWTMLNLINSSIFGSYWAFVSTFHEVIEGPFGKEIIGLRNEDQWHKVLDRNFSFVPETDPRVIDQRPESTRQLLTISMDAKQEKAYNQIAEEMLAFTDEGNPIFAQNALVQMTRLRQLLVCPGILAPELGEGAAIRDFADTMDVEGHHVIFCPYTAAFPWFGRYLVNRGFPRVWALQGGMGTEKRTAFINAYKEQGGVIICAVDYAQAFSLEPASKDFFIGYSYDPDVNRQAEARIRRLTSKFPVTHYYYTFRSTFDERLSDIVNVKSINMSRTLPKDFYQLVRQTRQTKI